MEHGIPDGDVKAAAVPGTIDAIVTLLKLYGTKSFEEVVQPTLAILDAGGPSWYIDTGSDHRIETGVNWLICTAIFIGYIVAISRLRDLRRVFDYHGAEHKTISCYEAGDRLTPARAELYSRLHPRCGTSFLLVVMVVAIFVFAPLGLPAWYWLLASRILGIPLIAGISYEVIKWAGRNRRKAWVRTLMWPGLMLQNLTTRKPDRDQLAVAIAALEAVLAVESPEQAAKAGAIEIVA